ncbi:ABC transporter ATP-binding protein [Enterococcus sp. AZ109]|uniref:ABC transporter ATP-binding protein n=1 Tax=Enterococcus sp. AZ109 TaxID=2774634 RepID=UPI003F22B659
MLQVNHLYKSYQSGNVTYDVLKDVSFTIRKGEFVGIMGSSGSGKTTLLNCISCFIPYEKGEILLNGTKIAALKEEQMAEVRNEKLGFVFQDFMLLDGLTIFENICLPKIIKNAPYKKMEARAKKLLTMFGISEVGDKYPVEISGGQKQRTAVARALMNNPLLILADEPTGNLDSKSGAAVINAFSEAKEELGATICMVTHDSFSASYCDRVIVMKDGHIFKEMVRSGRPTVFHDELLLVLKELNGGVGHELG